MKLTDSRRLTGANLLLDVPGAAAELGICDSDKPAAIERWHYHARKLLDALQWSNEVDVVREYEGGVTLAISAPIDALYSATEIVETAWDMAEADLRGQTIEDLGSTVTKLQKEITDECDAELLTLCDAAKQRGKAFLSDDDYISLGLGAFADIYPRSDVPNPDNVEWSKIANVPVALVTGTNGKSTTVRISAAIGAEAGRTVGFSSSDWVRAGKDVIAEGDYSGPEGARLAFRDPRVDMAIIETARGGLLRRGLPIPQATACLITNIASDHLGDYGIKDVPALADVKFIISKAVRHSGELILNVDDSLLLERAKTFQGNLSWFGLSINHNNLAQWATGSNRIAFAQDGMMWLAQNDSVIPILPIDGFSPALGGAATYNVANALGAIALTSSLGISQEHIAQGLRTFESTPEDNPGRGNFMEIGGVKIMLDFAHNPHGITALAKSMNNVPAKRRLYLLGQAGDRSDEDIRAMTRSITHSKPDRIIVKELLKYLRGREAGDIPAIIKNELRLQNYPTDNVDYTQSELEAVHMALNWAEPGDLLVFLVYQDRKKVLELLTTLQDKNWQPGQGF